MFRSSWYHLDGPFHLRKIYRDLAPRSKVLGASGEVWELSSYIKLLRASYFVAQCRRLLLLQVDRIVSAFPYPQSHRT